MNITITKVDQEIRTSVVYKVNLYLYMSAYENYINATSQAYKDYYWNEKEKHKRVIHELDYLTYGRM